MWASGCHQVAGSLEQALSVSPDTRVRRLNYSFSLATGKPERTS